MNPTNEGGAVLQIVAKNDETPTQRLSVARRHIETAIAHINDVAQSRVPISTVASTAGVDELRLIVRALADIREALRTSDWTGATAPVDPAPAGAER